MASVINGRSQETFRASRIKPSRRVATFTRSDKCSRSGGQDDHLRRHLLSSAGLTQAFRMNSSCTTEPNEPKLQVFAIEPLVLVLGLEPTSHCPSANMDAEHRTAGFYPLHHLDGFSKKCLFISQHHFRRFLPSYSQYMKCFSSFNHFHKLQVCPQSENSEICSTSPNGNV